MESKLQHVEFQNQALELSYSFCDERYVKTALFFKALEGFIEAGPQLALQLSLLFQGGWGMSSKLVMEPIMPEMTFDNETSEMTTTMLPETTILPFYEERNESLVIFDRLYTKGKTSRIKICTWIGLILNFVIISFQRTDTTLDVFILPV